MNNRAEQTIIAMLNCFPQTTQDYEALLATLSQLCVGLTDRAIIETAERFAAGDVKDQSTRFAPSSAEFIQEARLRQAYIDLASKPRLPAPDYRRGSLMPFEIRIEQKRSENSHLRMLLEAVSFEQFKALSASKQIPAGAKWVAALGAIFAPEQSV